MHRVAVVDVGTHSILYLLAEIDAKREVVSVYQEIQSVRLGRNVDNVGTIQGEVLSEALQVLKHYRELASKQEAEQIVVVGTQVFRTAKNEETVREAIQRETGLNLLILTEKEEAEWSYQGAVYGRDLEGPTSVGDIGGGSTEIILSDGDKIVDFESIRLGAVGLTEKFIHHDPPLQTECGSMEEHVLSSLEEVTNSLLKPGKRLVGVGGTVTTLAALDLRLKKYDPDRVDGYSMRYSNIEDMTDRMKRIPLAERKNLLKLDPKRADIILAGATVLKACMASGGFEEVIVSDRGLRFGIALRELTTNR